MWRGSLGYATSCRSPLRAASYCRRYASQSTASERNPRRLRSPVDGSDPLPRTYGISPNTFQTGDRSLRDLRTPIEVFALRLWYLWKVKVETMSGEPRQLGRTMMFRGYESGIR